MDHRDVGVPGRRHGRGRLSLLTRTVIETGLRNYELGLANGYPYVAFSAPDGSRVECVSGSAIPLNEWTHIAGRFELGGVPTRIICRF
jgi:hypothetical protein